MKFNLASMEAWRSRARRLSGGRRLSTSKVGASGVGEAVGFGLTVGGGILAFIAALSLLFIPTTTVTTLDDELILLFGAILFVVGVAVDKISDYA